MFSTVSTAPLQMRSRAEAPAGSQWTSPELNRIWIDDSKMCFPLCTREDRRKSIRPVLQIIIIISLSNRSVLEISIYLSTTNMCVRNIQSSLFLCRVLKMLLLRTCGFSGWERASFSFCGQFDYVWVLVDMLSRWVFCVSQIPESGLATHKINRARRKLTVAENLFRKSSIGEYYYYYADMANIQEHRWKINVG